MTFVVNGPQRPLTSLLRETNYASLTTKCLTVPGICTPQLSLILRGQLRTQVKSTLLIQYLLYRIQYNVGCNQTRDRKPSYSTENNNLMSDTLPRPKATRLRIKVVYGCQKMAPCRNRTLMSKHDSLAGIEPQPDLLEPASHLTRPRPYLNPLSFISFLSDKTKTVPNSYVSI